MSSTARAHRIVTLVCAQMGVDADEVFDGKKSQPACRARSVAIWLCRAQGWSIATIGRLFGRDDSSVRDAIRSVTQRASDLPGFHRSLTMLAQAIVALEAA